MSSVCQKPRAEWYYQSSIPKCLCFVLSSSSPSLNYQDIAKLQYHQCIVLFYPHCQGFTSCLFSDQYLRKSHSWARVPANWAPGVFSSKLGLGKLGPWKMLVRKIGPWKLKPLENFGAASLAPGKWCVYNIAILWGNGNLGPEKWRAQFTGSETRVPICPEPFVTGLILLFFLIWNCSFEDRGSARSSSN